MNKTKIKTVIAILMLALFVGPQNAAAASAAGQESLVFSELPASGVKVIQGFKGTPQGVLAGYKNLQEMREFKGTPEGVLAKYKMVIPPYERACYFSSDNNWFAAGNRVQPWMAGSDLAQLFTANAGGDKKEKQPAPDGMFVLFQLKSGEVLALFPLAGPETICWLHVNESGGLQLNLGTLGTAPVNADVPLLAWAKATDAAAACREIWRLITTNELTKNRTAFRSEKKYPEPFEYLGWCSWEQYKKRISSDLLCGAVEQIKKCGLPIRWVLVDDGFQTLEKKDW